MKCIGPQQLVRFEWNCAVRKVEDPNYRRYNPRVEKDELYCAHGKDVVQSLQSREHASLHIKQGANGRYLDTNMYRIVFGKVYGNEKAYEFKPGFRNEEIEPGCSLSYYIYGNFDVLEDKLIDVLMVASQPELIDDRIRDLGKLIKSQMEIDNKVETTTIYTIPTNFTTTPGALEDKSTESTVETEVVVG